MKLCLFCEYIDHSESIWWGGQTGGEGASYRCNKGNFEYESDLLEDIRGWAQQAETCKDYILDESIDIKG